MSLGGRARPRSWLFLAAQIAIELTISLSCMLLSECATRVAGSIERTHVSTVRLKCHFPPDVMTKVIIMGPSLPATKTDYERYSSPVALLRGLGFSLLLLGGNPQDQSWAHVPIREARRAVGCDGLAAHDAKRHHPASARSDCLCHIHLRAPTMAVPLDAPGWTAASPACPVPRGHGQASAAFHRTLALEHKGLPAPCA